MKNKINFKNLFSNKWFWVSIVLVILLAWLYMNSGNLNANNNQPNNPSQGSNPTVSVSVDDDAVLGDPNAPITIIEFSDYQCPYCGRFWSQTLPQLKEQYIDTGKAKLVYRDFPLVSIHQYAEKAAEAAEAARELGGDEAYFEMHDKIFANQNALTISDLKQYARQIGLDGNQFDSLLDSGKYADEVQEDFEDGAKAGVQGTPTFFINGQMLVGAQPFSAFQQVIEQEIA